MSELDLQNQSGSNKSTLVGVFFVLLSIVIYTLFVRPIGAANDLVKQQVDTKRQELVALEDKIKMLEQAEGDLQLNSEVEKQEVLKAVPASMKQDEVIKDLIEIAESYQVSLGSISFGKGVGSADEVGVLRINANFEGDYSDLESFLKGLEDNGRFFRVESINVQLDDLALSTVTRADFSLVIEAFFQK